MSLSFDEAVKQVCAPGSLFEITDTEIRGTKTRVFVGTPPNLRFLYQMAAEREDEFVIYEDERWTMPQILELSGEIGSALANEFNIEKGDRVAIAMRNYPEWIAAFTAITSIGAVAVPLNAWWEPDELGFAINDSGAKVIFADTERIQKILESNTDITSRQIVNVRSTSKENDSSIPLETLLKSASTMPEVQIDPYDHATI